MSINESDSDQRVSMRQLVVFFLVVVALVAITLPVTSASTRAKRQYGLYGGYGYPYGMGYYNPYTFATYPNMYGTYGGYGGYGGYGLYSGLGYGMYGK